jgi:predicted nuclease of predicted toxin-antitoxin system
MKWLVDNALSPVVALGLHAAGQDAVHVRDLALADGADVEIFERAKQDDRVLVSADTDFGALLAQYSETRPSIVLFRGATPRRPADQVALLPAFEEDLKSGAVVVIEPGRIRIRSLPIIRKS